MEIFPRPLNASTPLIKIPYLAQEEFSGDFLEYPQTHSLKQPPNVQTFAYFGLINTFFNDKIPLSLMIAEDEEDGKKYLSTSFLEKSLREFIDNKDEQRKEYLHKCLNLARQYILAGYVKASEEKEHRMYLFYALLIELLGAAFHSTFYGIVNNPVWQDTPKSFVNSALKSKGWCPHWVDIMNKTMNLSLVYYAANLHFAPSGDHEKCTLQKCIAYDVDEHYKPGHLCRNRLCKSLKVDDHQINDIYKRGSIPLVKFELDKDGYVIALHVIPLTPGLKYIVFSHLYVDGLGAHEKHSLPSCQLQKLYNICTTVKQHAKDDHEEIPFWIDGLCVPKHDGRAQALLKLRFTFQNAAYVVALDKWIRRHQMAKRSPEELLLLISFSSWSKRAWTFMEGQLASNLFFSFSDGLMDFNLALKQTYKNERRHAHPASLALGRPYRRYMHAENNLLDTIAHELVYRQMSFYDDEAIILAILFKIDVLPILTCDPAKRMKVFWSLAKGIPSSVIFIEGPKLTDAGFGWAPSTFSQAKKTETLGGQGLLRAEGLVGEYQAYVLGSIFGEYVEKDRGSVYNVLDSKGTLHAVITKKKEMHLKDIHKSGIAILLRPDKPTEGLLTSIYTYVDHVYFVTIVGSVQVLPYPDSSIHGNITSAKKDIDTSSELSIRTQAQQANTFAEIKRHHDAWRKLPTAQQGKFAPGGLFYGAKVTAKFCVDGHGISNSDAKRIERLDWNSFLENDLRNSDAKRMSEAICTGDRAVYTADL